MPLTVLYCVGSLSLGGTELNAVRTAAAFDPSRVRVVLATFRAEGPLLERYRALGIPIVDLGIQSLADSTMPRGVARLVRALRRYRPSVVHSHDQFANALCVPAARIGSRALVIASRRWGQSTPHRDRLNRFGSRYAHCVMANSPAVSQFSIREGIPAERMRVIPNFVDDHAFIRSTPEQRVFWRRTNGIPEQAIVIGCVARLDAVKEHAFLIAAFAQLATERGDVHLVLIGDGPLRESLEAQIRSSGLDGDRIPKTCTLVSTFPLSSHHAKDFPTASWRRWLLACR